MFGVFNNSVSEIPKGHLLLIDTQREEDIYLGTQYPFGTLEAGQCLIADYVQDEMDLNDIHAIQLYLNMTFTVTAVMENYNVLSVENGWEPLSNTTFNYTVTMPCTVVGFLDETYGKYNKD